MKYNLILENWKQFLQEADMASVAPTTTNNTDQQQTNVKTDKLSPAEEKENKIELHVDAIENEIKDVLYNAKKEGLTASDLKTKLISYLNQLQEAKKKRAKVVKKKSGDRCTRIAKRKYDVWPSAYASGAVVKCRQGKIWKGISENATDEEIDQELLLEEVEIIDEAKKKDYKPNFSKEKEQGLHGWFARNKGKGWVNCRTGGPCGRDSADSGGKYPACRPTKAQCKSAGKGPLRKKKSSKPISWTKKKKKD
jgi:hypothetical protein